MTLAFPKKIVKKFACPQKFDSTESRIPPCIHTKWLTAHEISSARDDIQSEWPLAI